MLVLKERAAVGGRATLTALAAHLHENPAKVHRYLASLTEESFAVAAPLFNVNGHLCATLTALGATGGFDASINGPIATALRQEAKTISAELGYVPHSADAILHGGA
jgi:DNA-binding IclR family transcriptional regulator